MIERARAALSGLNQKQLKREGMRLLNEIFGRERGEAM
jgi:hypothetical protein